MLQNRYQSQDEEETRSEAILARGGLETIRDTLMPGTGPTSISRVVAARFENSMSSAVISARASSVGSGIKSGSVTMISADENKAVCEDRRRPRRSAILRRRFRSAVL